MSKKQEKIYEKYYVNPLIIENTGKWWKGTARMMDAWGETIIEHLQNNGVDFSRHTSDQIFCKGVI